MDEKWDRFLTGFMAFPSIACIILLGVNKFQLCRSEWVTLITAWVSSTATIILGIMVYLQTEKHKRNAEQDREQDLMLKANPVAYFNSVSDFTYSDVSISTCANDPINRLAIKEFEGTATFPEYVSVNIKFNVPQGSIVDFIKIKSARLTCTKGIFPDDNYEEVASYFFINNNKEKISENVQITKDGQIAVYLQLMLGEAADYEDIKTEIFEQLKNPEYAWKLSFVYTIGNNFNVCVDKTTFIELSCLIPSENELDTKFSLDVSEPFTKLEKGVYISKE